MKLNDYLESERGLTKRLAEKLGVSASLLTQWARGKPVSAERCVPLELATGKLVRRWDLRPDDWHLIWPELIAADGAPSIAASIEPAHSEVANAA